MKTAHESSLESDVYRRPRFTAGTLVREMSFQGGPQPGQACPDFDLETTDGRRVRKSDFAGHRPVLLSFGSLTCPMTRAANPLLKKLYETHGGQVEFITVYVREAHPGDRIGQPATFEQKRSHAERLKTRDRLPWTVAVDDIDGSFHRRLGAHANALYVLDEAGDVAFRSLWSSDATRLREGLEAVSRGAPARRPQSHSRLLPMLAGLGVMAETLEQAGPRARRNAAPLYGLGKLASTFKPLPPAARGLAAVAVAVGALTLAGILVARGLRRTAR